MGATSKELHDIVSYREYLSAQGEDNSATHGRLKRNLQRAMLEELTPRQRQMVQLYFTDGLKMVQIAELLGVNVSTVSRTVRRGKEKLRRCLRFGAKELLTERK